MKAILAFLCVASLCSAAPIIPEDRLYPWIPGYTVGPQIPFPTRTNLLNVVTQFGADPTGAIDSYTNIQAAIATAVSNDVIYVPNGVYALSNVLELNKSWVTLRGQSTNAILSGVATGPASVLSVGNSAMDVDSWRTYTVTNGGQRGSTNLFLLSPQNHYGDTLKAGDMLSISADTRNTGTDAFPVLSTSGFGRIIKQVVVVLSRSGNEIRITAPLVWDFTNNAMLHEIETQNQPNQGIVVENLSITLTNGGRTGNPGYMLSGVSLRDCWFTNINLGFASQYHFYLTDSANVAVQHCDFHDTVTFATSNHGGLVMARCSGVLVENNLFFADNDRARGADGDSTTLGDNFQLFPAVEINNDVMGSAFFANHFHTNCLTTFHVHSTHPMMNLFEANNLGRSGISMDGYFGSASHFTFFRNANFTFAGKRWSSHLNFVGNSIGYTNHYSFLTYRTESAYGSPYALMERGFPAIGHNSYAAVSGPTWWNFPGTALFAGHANEWVTNGIFTFTGTYGPTNVLWTNMGVGYFTNLPDANISLYPLLFQDGTDTNFYYASTNKIPSSSADAIVALSKTPSNMTLNAFVYVTNGSKLFIVGANAYTQLQSSNVLTDIVHGNSLHTNGVGQAPTLSWHSDIADHSLWNSMIYSNGAPGWWGTNRWPAIDPEAATVVAVIPAENRFNGIDNGEGGGEEEEDEPELRTIAPRGLRIQGATFR